MCLLCLASSQWCWLTWPWVLAELWGWSLLHPGWVQSRKHKYTSSIKASICLNWHTSIIFYINLCIYINITHTKRAAPERSQGPLWTCASVVDSRVLKLHLHVTAPPAFCPLNPLAGPAARIPDCWAASEQLPLVAGPAPASSPGLQPGAPRYCCTPATAGACTPQQAGGDWAGGLGYCG